MYDRDNDGPKDRHVLLLVVGALVILWLMGVKVFKGVRV